jgi:NADP-dependent 3-hydroxy acid dehydrogenase YdfG
VQKALPLMKDGGSIILTVSSAALKGMDAFSVYAASKAAIRSFARGWTTDLKARKILLTPSARVSCQQKVITPPRYEPSFSSRNRCPAASRWGVSARRMKSPKPWFS